MIKSNNQKRQPYLNRIQAVIDMKRSQREGIFMPFLVIGDPDLESSLEAASVLIEAGADILEFGFPFSDPPADGATIQAANRRALKAGVTPPLAFEFLAELQRRHKKPTALLLYYNLALQYGLKPFYKRAAEVGVDAVLLADLPLEEADEALQAAAEHGVAPVFIVSELTSADRLKKMAVLSQNGYLYTVARLGITGEQKKIESSLPATLHRLRQNVSLPLLVGFGISQPEHVSEVLEAGADGVICGSAIARRIANNLSDRQAMLHSLYSFCKEMKAMTLAG